VLGAHATELTRLLQHSGVSLVVNRNWEEGMASSIRFGIAALPPACDAVLILLATRFAVTADDLRRLVSAWRGEDGVVAAAKYGGTVGVPAIFPRWCFSELAQLRGDNGAKSILERYRDRLATSPCRMPRSISTPPKTSPRPAHLRPAGRKRRSMKMGTGLFLPRSTFADRREK